MNDQRIAVLTDTGSDCPADFLAAHDVRVVPLRINYSDGSSYESGVDITTDEVVARFEQEIRRPRFPPPSASPTSSSAPATTGTAPRCS